MSVSCVTDVSRRSPRARTAPGGYRRAMHTDEVRPLLDRFSADASRVVPLEALRAHGSLTPGLLTLARATLLPGPLITKEALDVLAGRAAPADVLRG